MLVRSWKGDGSCWIAVVLRWEGAGVGREVPVVGQKGVVKCWSDGREVSDAGRKRDGRCWSEGKGVLSVGQKRKEKRNYLGVCQKTDGRCWSERREMLSVGQKKGMCWVLVRKETVDPGQERMC